MRLPSTPLEIQIKFHIFLKFFGLREPHPQEILITSVMGEYGYSLELHNLKS